MSSVHVPLRIEPARAPRPQPRHQERPDLRIVNRRRRRPSTRRVVSVLAISVFSLMLFATVAGHVLLLQQQQRIDRLTMRTKTEQASYNQLRLQVDTLQSPARIVVAARGLGLVQPLSQHWVAPVLTIPSNTSTSDAASGYGNGDYPQVKPFLGSPR